MRREVVVFFFTFVVLVFNSMNTACAEDIDYLNNIPNVRVSNINNHVSNPDSIISEEYIDSINNILCSLEDSIGTEVAVVAVKDIGDNEARQFANELFNKWGLGKKDKDNGLLILLVTKKEQRAIVFETGYGIEGIMPDIVCSRIQKQYMLPLLKDENYSKGMLEGVKRCSEILLKNEVVGDVNNEDNSLLAGMLYIMGFFISIYIIFFVIRPILIRRYKRAHPEICPECGKQTLLYESNKLTKRASYKDEGERIETYICSNCGKKVEKIFKIDRLSYSAGHNLNKRRTTNYNTGSGRGSWGGGKSGGGGSMTKF